MANAEGALFYDSLRIAVTTPHVKSGGGGVANPQPPIPNPQSRNPVHPRLLRRAQAEASPGRRRVVARLVQDADPEREMGRGDRSAGQVGAELSPAREVPGSTRRASHFPSQNGRSRPRASRQRPWASVNARCGRTAASSQRRGKVGPEEDLGVPRHPPLERRPGVIVTGRDLVEDPAVGREDAAVARPAEPEGEVDVFVVGVIRRVEAAHLAQRRGAIEARSTRWRRRRARAGGRTSGGPARRARACWASRRACRNRRPNRPATGRSGPGPGAPPSRPSDRRTAPDPPRSSPRSPRCRC